MTAGGLDFTTCKWRKPRIITALLMLEFCCLTTLLGLVGFANPDTYRTALYKDGISNGFISELFTDEIPLVWKPRATNVTLWLTLVSFLILVLQTIAFILSLFPPLAAIVGNALLIAIHAALGAVYQIGAGGDTPWFLRRSCSTTFYPQNVEYCRQAQGIFGVSVVLVGVYGGVFAWACVAILTSEKGGEETEGGWKVEAGKTEEQNWEEMDPYLQH